MEEQQRPMAADQISAPREGMGQLSWAKQSRVGGPCQDQRDRSRAKRGQGGEDTPGKVPPATTFFLLALVFSFPSRVIAAAAAIVPILARGLGLCVSNRPKIPNPSSSSTSLSYSPMPRQGVPIQRTRQSTSASSIPLDTAKVRLQLQKRVVARDLAGPKYRGLLGTAATIAKEEGAAALWKGIGPGLHRRCIYDGRYEPVKSFYVGAMLGMYLCPRR
ncbi:brain mitochondrial carrier protein 1-like [Triticum dicoccoides]|uniref:brain mitochondrial carrier protein 1-like n=1 Tax=Triticum dicoccoides TaxID=85692 RepID=UPI0018904A00|nr:brain mitochondrial carrier protein 1-like [Triticum dicoccoides]XP_037430432.1 brain mitochondrial carrier protein 1-like [Triticum dicoccoides]